MITGWWLVLRLIASIVNLSRSADPEIVWQVSGEGRGTPAVHESSVYFLSKRHEVMAVEVASGRIRWRRSTGELSESTAGSRVLTARGIVMAGDYDVVSFREDGTPLWRFSPVHGYGAGLYLGDATDTVVVAGSPAGRLYAIDVETGREAWSAAVVDGSPATVFAPALSRDLVVAGYTSFTSPSAGGIVAYDIDTGRERWRWRLPGGAPHGDGTGLAGGPVDAGDVILAAGRDGRIHALDRESGQLRWSLPAVVADAGEDFRALATNGDTLVAGSLNGTVVSYDLVTRRERWRRRPVEASVAFGLVSDRHRVYVPYLSGHLVALDADTGAERWRTTGGAKGFNWTPLPAGDRVYAAASGAGFFAFRR